LYSKEEIYSLQKLKCYNTKDFGKQKISEQKDLRAVGTSLPTAFK